MQSNRSKTRRPVGVLLLLCFWPFGFLAAAEEKPLWLAIGPKALVGPLGPLVKKRQAEGLETVVSSESIEKALAATTRRPTFLLLVGDDLPGKESEVWHLAAKRSELYRWRDVQRKKFASDAAWGDIDGDLIPDMAVGRIPARAPRQVELVVRKILAFERQQPTEADLALPIWGGSAEYGPAIDAMATNFLLGMVHTNAPKWMSLWIISGNPRHPLCGWPPDQPALFTGQIRRGGICGVMMGHANADQFYSMSHRGNPIWYTAEAAETDLAEGPPAPPLLIFSCESGDFTRPKPCMAEAFLFFPGGPVATVAATTESHPLTNYFSGLCLLRATAGPEDRLGTLWLNSQRQAMKTKSFLVERVLRDVEGKLEEKIDVEKLRRDQILMYALLGDPATRLRIPQPLAAEVHRTEDGWQWKADRPDGATSLRVSFRSTKPSSTPWQKPPTDAEAARAAFKAANAPLAFRAVASKTESAPWQGTVDTPGLLRLVATGPGKIYVAVLQLE